MNEINHKTIFVLDHTPYFGISCESSIDLEFIKSKIPIPPISKSLWTCAVEASVEYCRIVWDLFPSGKLVRFVVSDSAAHIVNTWNVNTQSITHVMNAMSMVGVPPRVTQAAGHNNGIIHGLRAAIEGLAEPTDFQTEQLSASKLESVKLINTGRVICITSARDDQSMKSLEDIFHTVLLQQNNISATDKRFFNIDHCHLVIINLFPSNMESMVSNRGLIEISANLKTEIHSNKANKISNKLTHLILPHFDLASTTVTGIPMKEEQNASSSANYDVEIFHGSKAHSVFLGTELVLPHSVKDGADYETVTLKWCTPRSCGSSEMQPCLAQYRVTPVDVTSRPSSCLINFLLNGRSVLLEMPRKSGGKLTSHLLSAHGGEIFIHSLNTARSCLEEPPSISEGGGGRVTDYRITDFGQLMQAHRIVPLKPVPERHPDENLLKMRTKLYKNSRYWPLTLGATILYNVRQFTEPLTTLIQKPDISDEEVIQCQQAIYGIMALEKRHEPLALPNMGHRLKGTKKEDQYRLLWTEMEIIVAASGTSNGHKTVLKSIRECRTQGSDQIAEKIELEQAIKELDSLSDSEAAHRASVIRATTDSPLSPPMLSADSASSSRNKKTLNAGGNKSLFDIIASTERLQNSKRLDFSGRLCTPPGQIAKLYPALGLKEAAGREGDVK